MNHTYIIAEAGVNHNGNIDTAIKLIDKAKSIGVDAIKFQLFDAAYLVTAQAEQAGYQKKSAKGFKNQLQMLQELELPFDAYYQLKFHADKCGIDFLVTPFCLKSLDFLIQELNLGTIKISSGDVCYGPLLYQAAKQQVKIILSTGMCALEEIEQALKVIAFGYIAENKKPSFEGFNLNYQTALAQDKLKTNVTLLHCVSEYPAPLVETNLKAMDVLKEKFGLPVGLSDHSEYIWASVAAVAREASTIEKHFTLDNTMSGPDHKASLDVKDFAQMVEAIRAVEQTIGTHHKKPTTSELKNKQCVRRSIVANNAIKPGELFSEQNLTFKRPENGLSPMQYWDKLGQVSTQNYEKDDVII